MSDDLRTVGITNRDALADAIEADGLALARLLHVSGPGHATTPVPGLDWNVAETAAHVLTVVRRALGDRRRSATPAETAVLNAMALSAVDLRDPVTLGMEIARDTQVVARRVLAQVRDGDTLIPFHAGTQVRALDAFGALLAELVVHGHDIARALGVRQEAPSPHAALALRAFLAVMPGWLDPERAGTDRTFRLDVGGLPAVVRVTVSGGVLTAAWDPDLQRDTEPLDPLSALLALNHRVKSVDPDLASLADVLLPF
ncbi:MAG: maleylpyruvate isomerase N-terminal domain-containing protein [Nocardioides sp.]